MVGEIVCGGADGGTDSRADGTVGLTVGEIVGLMVWLIARPLSGHVWSLHAAVSSILSLVLCDHSEVNFNWSGKQSVSTGA